MSIQNMKRSETTEQIALFNWAKRTESILPELALMYHVPNEGKRSNGGILKAAGLKSGVPDICLPVANNGFHGLYIELKFGKNDRNLYRLGTIENHTSLQWHRKYYECGTFELHAPATKKNIRLLQPGNVIRPKGKDEAAVIRGDQTEEESTLVNEVVRNGYFLPIYFNDRLTGPMFTFNGTCEDAMRYMINRMAAVPLLEVAPGIGDATKITFQATYKNVLTYLSKIARYCELGFRVVPDFKGKKMTFETYKGIDRTKKQGTKPRVIFSESYNNLNRAKHTYSDETAKTKIVVGGAGDGADRIYVTVGGGTGFDLREEFLDAKDINKDDFSTNAEYLEALRIRGEQYKAENAVIENIEAEVEAEVNFIYGTDYDLGDIVTVEKAKWNKVLNLRITELCEVYEYGGMYVVPTFGDALPTTINWDN